RPQAACSGAPRSLRWPRGRCSTPDGESGRGRLRGAASHLDERLWLAWLRGVARLGGCQDGPDLIQLPGQERRQHFFPKPPREFRGPTAIQVMTVPEVIIPDPVAGIDDGNVELLTEMS